MAQIPTPPNPGADTRTGAASSPFDLDLSGILSTLQAQLEQELTRLRSEHEIEKRRLQEEIEELRQRCSSQDDRLSSMKDHLRTLLIDYRGELEGQIQRAETSRTQITRVQETLNSIAEPPGPKEGVSKPARQFTPAPQVQPPLRVQPVQPVQSGVQSIGDPPSRVLVNGESAVRVAPPVPSSEDTVQLTTHDASVKATQISITGINSVSAMMRARKAVEGLSGAQSVESRYASDGKLYFTIRTRESAEDVAKSLTSLQDPPLRATSVADGAIELEM